MKYKTGDVVKVWSLQSFSGGGFINGEEGIVSQNQTGDSVLVAVKRKIDSEYKIDPFYEVYEQQLKLIRRPKKGEKVAEFVVWLNILKGEK